MPLAATRLPPSAEEPAKIVGRRDGDLGEFDPAQLCDLFGDTDDECRLVALAAVRHRRQKRAVRLDQDPVDRNSPRGFADAVRRRKRHDPREADVEPECDRRPSHDGVVAEAMEHAPAGASIRLVAQDLERSQTGGSLRLFIATVDIGDCSVDTHGGKGSTDGDGAYRCMKAALKRAGVSVEDIDYVNAHGTSTPLGDEIELKAVERLLGNVEPRLAMSSTKSAIGHLLGAAGAVEAIYSILAMQNNVAPPTRNLDNPSVDTAIDLVPHKAREKEINIALSNSFGFGGTNASLLFRRAA